MFTPVSMCPKVKVPSTVFSSNINPNCQNFGGNFMGSFQPQFVNNGTFFPACNTNAFMDVPPPRFNGMTTPGGNSHFMQLPVQQSNQRFFSAPNYSPHNINSFNPISTYSSFNSSNFVHSAVQHRNACTNFSDSRYQNFSMSDLSNNHILCQTSTFPILPSQATNKCRNNFDTRQKFASFNSGSFNKTSRSSREEKSMPFHCESCDRGFIIKEKYDIHVSEHITCGKQGCSFRAHPKIVEKHIVMQHRSGLFNRIVRGNSLEEINKWISERKKQYPTKEKVKQKAALKIEMDNRGECYKEEAKRFYSHSSITKSRRDRFIACREKKLPLSKLKTIRKKFDGPVTSRIQLTENIERITKKKPSVELNETEACCVQRNLSAFCGTAYYDDDVDNSLGNCSEKSRTAIYHISKNLKQKNYFFNETESNSGSETEENFSDLTLNNLERNEFLYDEDISVAAHKKISNNEEENEISNDFEVKIAIKSKQGTTQSTDEIQNTATLSAAIQEYSFKQNRSLFEISKNVSKEMHPSSLDLIKGYNSTDEENIEIFDQDRSINPRYLQRCNNENDTGDNGPDECSSKFNIHLESGNFLVTSVNFNSAVKEESCPNANAKKQTRKRRRHIDNKNEEQELKILENKQSVQANQNYKRFRRPTLLEKLLASEIRHERNLILQCVRHVVENNYFDDGK